MPGGEPEPISMGIIVDFAARTVEFGREIKSFPIGITDITETAISFFGSDWSDRTTVVMSNINEAIDRVTGAGGGRRFFGGREAARRVARPVTAMAQVLTNGVLSAAGAMKPGQGMKIAQLGMRMLAPPASPLRQGAPPAQLSTAGQNPQVAQFQQMFGVDYQTALAMMQSPTP